MSGNSEIIPPHDEVAKLIKACPFLEGRLGDQDLPYGAMGALGLMVIERSLSDAEIQQVFDYVNAWSMKPDCDLDLLGAGFLEMLNDDQATARLARHGLKGRALEMIEALRVGWGQPDYS